MRSATDVVGATHSAWRRPIGWLLTVVLLCGGCSPFHFSADKAIAIDKDRLLAIADQAQGDHLYYAGSDYDYHYLVDTRAKHGQAYKIEPKQLKLVDTFERGEDEPYIVYPHVIAGKKIGSKPREQPALGFDIPKGPFGTGGRLATETTPAKAAPAAAEMAASETDFD